MSKLKLYIKLKEASEEKQSSKKEQLSSEIDTLKTQPSVLNLLESINIDLKKYYSGKYYYDLCKNDEGIVPDKLKLTPKKKRRIKEKWLEFNSELSKIQRDFETFIQESFTKKHK